MTAASLFPRRRFILTTVRAGDAIAFDPGRQELGGIQDAEVVVVEAARGGERGVAEQLVACAVERQAAVVAVGSRGRSPAREILLGSVAMGVLHRAQRPVLVVPARRVE
jgi:nucleotide-binding universal stress UspA family protein